MKNDNRVPKSAVIELLEKRGLTMKRKTLPKVGRAWVVSDGKAFHSLKQVYSFYYRQDTQKQRGIGMLLDKIRGNELPHEE